MAVELPCSKCLVQVSPLAKLNYKAQNNTTVRICPILPWFSLEPEDRSAWSLKIVHAVDISLIKFQNERVAERITNQI
jgi:hypothetical protein